MNDAVLVELALALALVRGGARLRRWGRVGGVRLVLGRSSHGLLFLWVRRLSKLFLKFGMAMLKLMLLPDLTSPTPYAKSCHGKGYRVQGSREREGSRRCELYRKLVSTRFTGRRGSWTRELPRGCHVSGGLGVGTANKAQQ